MEVESRLFKDTDAPKVTQLIARTLMTTNIHDYSKEYLEHEINRLNEAFFIQKAQQTHFYVFTIDQIIVGTGAIGKYWNIPQEFSLFTIFVEPNFQGQGIGKFIIQTLENDPYFKAATRVEIPASITALGFYKKMGYQPKNGQTKPDAEKLFRLEKYPLHI